VTSLSIRGSAVIEGARHVPFAFCLLVYFLPSIIGHQTRSFGGVFVLNLLLGWTVIGWIAALMWACVDEVRVPVFAWLPDTGPILLVLQRAPVVNRQTE